MLSKAVVLAALACLAFDVSRTDACEAVEKAGTQYINQSLPSVVETFQDWGGRGDEPAKTLARIIKSNLTTDALSDDEDFKEYASEQAAYAAPGIFLFCLSFLFGIGLIIGRCLCPGCCPCCNASKHKDDYSQCEKWWPLILLVMIAAIASIFAIIGIVYLEDIKVGANEMVCHLEGMAADAQSSFGGFYDKLETMNEVIDKNHTSLEARYKDRAGTCDECANVKPVPHQAKVKTAATNLTTAAALIKSDNKQCVDGDFNSATAIELFHQTKEVAEKLRAGFETAYDKVASDDVLGKVKDFKDACELGLDALKEVKDYADVDLPENVADIKKQRDDNIDSWTAASTAFFAIVFLSLIVAFFAVFAYLTPCTADDKLAAGLLSLSWFLSWFFATVLFLMCGLAIPGTVVFSDSCWVMDDVPNDVKGYFGGILDCKTEGKPGSPTGCSILDSCLGSEEVNYYNVLIGTPYNFTELVDFSELDKYIDGTEWSEYVSAIKSNATAYKTCLETNHPNYEFTGTGKKATEYIDEFFLSSDSSLVKFDTKYVPAMKADVKLMMDATDDIKDAYTAVSTDTNSCNFIGKYYDEVIGSLCGSTLEGIAGSVLMMFLVAVMGLPQIVVTIYVTNRDFGHLLCKGGDQNKVAPQGVVASSI